MNGQETSSATPKRFRSWDKFRTEAKPGDTYVERDFYRRPFITARCFEPGGFFVVWSTATAHGRRNSPSLDKFEVSVAYGRGGHYSMSYPHGFPNRELSVGDRDMHIGHVVAYSIPQSEVKASIWYAFKEIEKRVAQFRATGGREY